MLSDTQVPHHCHGKSRSIADEGAPDPTGEPAMIFAKSHLVWLLM